MGKGKINNRFKSPYGRPGAPAKIRTCWDASPTEHRDSEIEALRAQVRTGDGYGPDLAPEEIERMQWESMCRSVSVTVVSGQTREQWRLEQAHSLLNHCIDKGWSNVLPAVWALGEPVDLGAALRKAAGRGRLECLKALLAIDALRGMNVGDAHALTTLSKATTDAYPSREKATPYTSDAEAVDANGNTALHTAAANGHTDCVKALLPVSDPTSTNFDGQNALLFAAFWGHTDCVQVLLAVSDLKAKDCDGMTATALAKRRGRDECARLIDDFEMAQAEREALAKIAPINEKTRRVARSL